MIHHKQVQNPQSFSNQSDDKAVTVHPSIEQQQLVPGSAKESQTTQDAAITSGTREAQVAISSGTREAMTIDRIQYMDREPPQGPMISQDVVGSKEQPTAQPANNNQLQMLKNKDDNAEKTALKQQLQGSQSAAQQTQTNQQSPEQYTGNNAQNNVAGASQQQQQLQFGASNDISTSLRLETQNTAGKRKKKKVKKKSPLAGSMVTSERSESTAQRQIEMTHQQQQMLPNIVDQRPADLYGTNNSRTFDQMQNQLQFVQSPMTQGQVYVPIVEESEEAQVQNFIENYEIRAPGNQMYMRQQMDQNMQRRTINSNSRSISQEPVHILDASNNGHTTSGENIYSYNNEGGMNINSQQQQQQQRLKQQQNQQQQRMMQQQNPRRINSNQPSGYDDGQIYQYQEPFSQEQSIEADPQHALLGAGAIVPGGSNHMNGNNKGRPTELNSDDLLRVQSNENEREGMGQIMSQADFLKVKEQFRKDEEDSQRLLYRLRKWLSTSSIMRFCCCCLKVKPNLSTLEFRELTPEQKKYKVTRWWMKARLVFYFVRMKQTATNNLKRKSEAKEGDDDADVDLDYINTQQETEWKWYIIRQENTLPQLWNFLINSLTVYAMFATPFVLVFPAASENIVVLELFTDICFTIDIVMNFFKLNQSQKESDMKQMRIEYMKWLFWVDCVAAIPGLVTLEKNEDVDVLKLARFVHFNRFFEQLNLIVEKILMSWLGYTKQKISEYVDFIKLELTVLLLTHIMACLWVRIGMLDDQGWVNVFIADQVSPDNPEEKAVVWDYVLTIYANAFYFILTTITTVGYGDITGGTTIEYLFSMCVEFIGLTFFSFLTGTISVMFSGDQSFEALINARMEELDLWLLRLENCNKEEKIPNKLYHSIKEFIQDAFIYDFNLIIEEFPFYNELPASIQNQISESLFRGFKQSFNNFFLNTDVGFQNQLIIHMYCRIYEPGKTIVQHGQKFSEMYFVTRGAAVLYDQKGVTPFLQLPQYSFFGEYQLMFDLRSNFVVKVGGKEDTETVKQERTTFLCVSQDVFKRLFALFPKSRTVVQRRALERRSVFMQHLAKLEQFLKKKNKKQRQLQQSRQDQVKVIKGVFGMDKQSIKPARLHAFMPSEDSSSDQDDKAWGQQKRRKAADDFEDSELSDDQHYRMTELLDNVEGRNGDAFLTTPGEQDELGKEEDPEAKARDDYNRKLMDFRRDELVLNEESDGNDDGDDSDGRDQAPKDKNIQGVEDAYALVEKIEDKMIMIGNVVRGMDKRMSYNLRLMGSIIMPSQEELHQLNQQLKEEDKEEEVEAMQISKDIQNMLKDTTLPQRKQIVTSKVKKLSDFALKKLDMKARDMEQIEALKQRLQSIDQVELKKKLLQKGLGNFVLEQYLEKHNIAVDGKRLSDIVTYGK